MTERVVMHAVSRIRREQPRGKFANALGEHDGGIIPMLGVERQQPVRRVRAGRGADRLPNFDDAWQIALPRRVDGGDAVA